MTCVSEIPRSSIAFAASRPNKPPPITAPILSVLIWNVTTLGTRSESGFALSITAFIFSIITSLPRRA